MSQLFPGSESQAPLSKASYKTKRYKGKWKYALLHISHAIKRSYITKKIKKAWKYMDINCWLRVCVCARAHACMVLKTLKTMQLGLRIPYVAVQRWRTCPNSLPMNHGVYNQRENRSKGLDWYKMLEERYLPQLRSTDPEIPSESSSIVFAERSLGLPAL